MNSSCQSLIRVRSLKSPDSDPQLRLNCSGRLVMKPGKVERLAPHVMPPQSRADHSAPRSCWSRSQSTRSSPILSLRSGSWPRRDQSRWQDQPEGFQWCPWLDFRFHERLDSEPDLPDPWSWDNGMLILWTACPDTSDRQICPSGPTPAPRQRGWPDVWVACCRGSWGRSFVQLWFPHASWWWRWWRWR